MTSQVIFRTLKSLGIKSLRGVSVGKKIVISLSDQCEANSLVSFFNKDNPRAATIGTQRVDGVVEFTVNCVY